MGLNTEEHIQIPRRTTPLARVALVGHPQAGAGVDTGGNIDPKLFAHLLQTLATTGITGIGNHLT